MDGKNKIVISVTCCLITYLMCAHAQSTTEVPGRTFELVQEDLILLNVAAKGRVVELLANELARTEIVRALLVEYARECMENVTTLEKYCLDCMMERCSNRMSECQIKGPPISELINHSPSPIKGVQFLSQSSRTVNEGMRNFANKARTDILQGVPETLREQSEAIMSSEVDQSLQDLNENINTEKALQKISLHVQKAAENVDKLPEVSDKLGAIIVDNEDHAINLAELLARRLKDSRPFLESIGHNGKRIMDEMPTVIDEVGERVQVFKQKVSGVFNKVLNTFHKVMNDPETPVMNGNMQQQMVIGPTFNPQPLPVNPNMPGINQFPRQPGLQGINGIQIPGVQFQGQFPSQGRFQGQQLTGQGQIQGQQFPGQGQLRQQPVGVQFPQGSGIQGQGQWPAISNQIPQGIVFANGQQNQGQVAPMSPLRNMVNQAQMKAQEIVQKIAGSQAPPQQGQGQLMVGRRRRHVDPDCQRLKDDPDTYCRTYESLCHNCTLEKRLRFEVCGEGVEKARDEIKRIDESVTNYLRAYEDYVAKGPIVLKVELNTKNRLHKTNSFYEAFVTAKVGPSIFRYTTKMILNINEIRSTGLQLGDELWEKLWANNVFVEARKPEIVPQTENIMGQVHVEKVHEAHAQSVPTGSASVIGNSLTYFVSTLLSLLLLLI